jgi:hypothetical protein
MYHKASILVNTATSSPPVGFLLCFHFEKGVDLREICLNSIVKYKKFGRIFARFWKKAGKNRAIRYYENAESVFIPLLSLARLNAQAR